MEKLSNLLTIDNKTVAPNPDEYYEYYTVPNYGEENFPYQEKGSHIQSSKNIVKKGHLLVCKINPRISRIYYVNKDSSITQIASTEFMPFVVNEKRLFPKYIEMFLKTPHVQSFFQSRATGTSNSHKRMKPKDVLDLEIPLPHINIQEEIAEKLSFASSLLKEREKANQLTDKLIQAFYIQMFGDNGNSKNWKIVRLGEISKIVMGQSPSGSTYNKNGKGIPMLNGPSEFTEFNPIPIQWTTSPIKLAEKGQILFCVRGATAGRMNWADQSYAIGRGLASISGDNENSTTEYIFQFLLQLQNQFRDIRTTTFPNVSMKSLESLKILLPPITIQHKFSQIFIKTSSLSVEQRFSLKSIQDLFTTLISQSY